jgi:2'-5' RNA ligase
MRTIRAFIAVTLPEDLAAYLGNIAAALDDSLPSRVVRWVRPELMHITLRFLGDTESDHLPAVYAAMEKATADIPAFAMTLTELGCFPNARRPRVIWAGLQDNSGHMATLHAALDAALAPLGWEPETKPFRPHLTLGRVKGNPRDLADLPWGRSLEPRVLSVGALRLIESQLRPSGPVYTIRHSAWLGS